TGPRCCTLCASPHTRAVQNHTGVRALPDPLECEQLACTLAAGIALQPDRDEPRSPERPLGPRPRVPAPAAEIAFDGIASRKQLDERQRAGRASQMPHAA